MNNCATCKGSGRHVYSDTTMGMGGFGGQMMTEGPCPGTRRRPDWSDCPAVVAAYREEERPCIDCKALTNGYFTGGTHGPGWYCGWCEAIPAA